MAEQELSFGEPSFDLDFHQLLIPKQSKKKSRKDIDQPPRPTSEASSFFIPEPLSRSNSVYSFARASLSSQLQGLNALSVPQAETLATSISSLPTARKACKALYATAESIGSWNRKAARILKDLDADDDIEWAAAAGRDALDEVDKTINSFENLISVYVQAIEELQAREDISDLRPEHLSAVVEQMEFILFTWDDVRKGLKKIHRQVELAMEWEELWNIVLGEVSQEMDALSQLVFEMEEKRHQAYMTRTQEELDTKIDINELETFMGESGKKRSDAKESRFSMTFDSSPIGSPITEHPQEDTKLISLFARMQPLRASLDFLPMRASVFETRAENAFPTACRELKDKRERLEKSWTQLSEEADTLRKELSEDRWIVVFRNAGKQATKMAESVEKSVSKVLDAVNAGYAYQNPAALAKRVESFEAKKMHYMPAISRVLTIIQKGLKDRLTVNGEILRLNKELSARYRDLSDRIEQLSLTLDPLQPKSNSRLRESISSIVSADRSLSSANTWAGTPGSSPASSIDLPPQHFQKPLPRYGLNGYSRPRPTSRPPPISANNRRMSVQAQMKRPQTPGARLVNTLPKRAASPAPPSVYSQGIYKPPVVPLAPRRPETPSDRPRWTSVVRSAEADGANKRASITPSTYYRLGPRSVSQAQFNQPLKSPLGRQSASSPVPPHSTPLNSRTSQPHLRSFAERIKEPDCGSLLAPMPYPKSRNLVTPTPGTYQSSPLSSTAAASAAGDPVPSSTILPIRAASSLRSPHVNAAVPQRLSSKSNEPKYAQSPNMYSLDAMMSSPPHRAGVENTEEKENMRTRSHSHTSEVEDDRSTDLGSSPLSKRTAPRPPSSIGSGRTSTRVSMLPIPKGRTSSVGSRA